MLNILLLGYSSFIGKNIRTHFAHNKNLKIVALGRSEPKAAHDNITYHQMDSFENIEQYKSCFEGIDCVIHLISATIPSNNNIDFEKKNNVHPTEMLLKIMLECGVRKIIYFSSGGAIYGNQNDIIIFENATCNPLSTYGKGKKMIEELIQSDAINKGLQAVILRPSNIYGAQFNNEGKQGLINTLLNNCLNDVTTEIWGNGSVVRDYIHIDDIVLLLEKIISNFVPGVYNVGSGIGYSVNEIFKIAAQVIDKPIERTNKENQANAPSNVVLDIQKIKKTFDFEPSIPIELGIKKTWEYYLLASKIS